MRGINRSNQKQVSDDLPLVVKVVVPEKRERRLPRVKESEAQRLIFEADRYLANSNSAAVTVKGNYIAALNIREQLFGFGDKKLVSVLDRLAKVTRGGDAAKYQERALEILEATSSAGPLELAARHTELAGYYREAGNREQSNKHFARATLLWRESSPENDSEGLGDYFMQESDPALAAQFYSCALSEAKKEFGRLRDVSLRLTTNPVAARIHQKLGDAYLAAGDLSKADVAYTNAWVLLASYREVYGNGVVLSEELTAVASKLMVQCRLHENDPNIDLVDAKLFLRELDVLESKYNAKDSSLRDQNYGLYCEYLPWFLDAIASHYSSNGQPSDAKAVFDRLHAIEKARKNRS